MNPTETTLTVTAETQAPQQDLAKLQIESEKVEVEADVETNVYKEEEKEDRMEEETAKEEKLEKIETVEIITANAEETQEAIDGKVLAADPVEESVNQKASAEKIHAENVAVAEDEAVIEDKDESSKDVIQE